MSDLVMTDGECLPIATGYGLYRPVRSHVRRDFPAEGTTFLL